MTKLQLGTRALLRTVARRADAEGGLQLGTTVAAGTRMQRLRHQGKGGMGESRGRPEAGGARWARDWERAGSALGARWERAGSEAGCRGSARGFAAPSRILKADEHSPGATPCTVLADVAEGCTTGADVLSDARRCIYVFGRHVGVGAAGRESRSAPRTQLLGTHTLHPGAASGSPDSGFRSKFVKLSTLPGSHH